ncbi:dienelactone hydrolase family protein [Streptomyces sp. ODS28]|uniref:dienelactone hydrolase family protein n=1 Tax=Streptomyces sp. ODS28 TaxID=3136688 RepID=UPI0031E5ECCF
MPSTHLDIPTPDGTADAFAAWPEGGGSHPGVLFYMDVIGLRPVLHEMVTTLASHGYYVLAPNVFYREGRAPIVEVPDMSSAEAREAFMGQVLPMLGRHTVEHVERDAGAYLDFLTAQPQVAPGPVGLTGYCMGGVLALRAAALRPEQVAAAASFHAGRVVTDAADSPHLLADTIRAELHFGHAEHDDSMTPQDVKTLEQTLDAAGVPYTSEVYPDTIHGFTMADTAAYNPAALDRHWDRLLSLYGRTLGDKS